MDTDEASSALIAKLLQQDAESGLGDEHPAQDTRRCSDSEEDYTPTEPKASKNRKTTCGRAAREDGERGSKKRPRSDLNKSRSEQKGIHTISHVEQAKPKRNTATLSTLISSGILSSGKDVLSTLYQGVTYTSDLNSEGCIEFEGTVYVSPSAWSLAIKRRINPTRKADDGWKCVKYNGRLLADIKDGVTSAPTNSEKGTVSRSSKVAKRQPPSASVAATAQSVAGRDGDAALSPPTDFEYMLTGKTEYSKQRPQRERKKTQAPVLLSEAKTVFPEKVDGNDHQLIPCTPYSTDGTGWGSQPFKVHVARSALILMDTHAHLAKIEIIGLLGGSWPARIQACPPPGLLASGPGRLRAWSPSGLVASGPGRLRAWSPPGLVASGPGRLRTWSPPGLVASPVCKSNRIRSLRMRRISAGSP
ncbi:hypothetical protein CYMTET_23423 [Cymbomonas tetramitiformis]|uniref:RAMA domain-containing protein n=1 Tax=Cymbomonas tetramitiformis TaxID=36881 RepID=A0AAE0FYN9_9CHLO|nr:hypothetical protein CYMTET_23423 [Cymbomonas tetramitiformis]